MGTKTPEQKAEEAAAALVVLKEEATTLEIVVADDDTAETLKGKIKEKKAANAKALKDAEKSEEDKAEQAKALDAMRDKVLEAGLQYEEDETVPQLVAKLNANKDNKKEEVIPGVPNRVEPMTELNSKGKAVAIWHTRKVKGGSAVYNEKGQRVSQLIADGDNTTLQKHNRMVAHNNAIRRTRALPQDK